MKNHLLKLEQRLGQLGERLVPELKNKNVSNDLLVKEMRRMLDKRMDEHSSKPELTSYFGDLFQGLDAINSPQKAFHSDPLHPSHSESDILGLFDQRYFRGKATFAFTTKLMADKRVRSPEHFVRAVAQGGTILYSWTHLQRELFHLHVANKLWLLGDRDLARSRLESDYDRFWKDRLVRSDLPSRELMLLTSALVNTGVLPHVELLAQLQPNLRSLFVAWQNTIRARTAPISPMTSTSASPSASSSAALPLAHTALSPIGDLHVSWVNEMWPALNYLSGMLTNLPTYLSFVPASAARAPQQVGAVLARHAQYAGSRDLLDLIPDTEPVSP